MEAKLALSLVLGAAFTAAAAGCAGGSAGPSLTDETLGSANQALVVGGHLAGISDADFTQSRLEFEQVEDEAEGLELPTERTCWHT